MPESPAETVAPKSYWPHLVVALRSIHLIGEELRRHFVSVDDEWITGGVLGSGDLVPFDRRAGDIWPDLVSVGHGCRHRLPHPTKTRSIKVLADDSSNSQALFSKPTRSDSGNVEPERMEAALSRHNNVLQPAQIEWALAEGQAAEICGRLRWRVIRVKLAPAPPSNSHIPQQMPSGFPAQCSLC